MLINRQTALKVWEKYYGKACFGLDFHGKLMARDAYGNRDATFGPGLLDLRYRTEGFTTKCNSLLDYSGLYRTWIYNPVPCGWNLHHILPKDRGGTNHMDNLLCTNYITNDKAGNRITFWIDDRLYQVKWVPEKYRYQIFDITL